jgi:hypothetical protein
MHMGGLLVTPWTLVGPPRRVLRAAVQQIGSDMLSWMEEQSRWAPAHHCSEWGLRDAGPEAGHLVKLCVQEYLFGLIHAVHTHTCTYMIHTRYMQKNTYIHDTYMIHTHTSILHICTCENWYAHLEDTIKYMRINTDTYRFTLQGYLVESVCIRAYLCICRAYVVHMCAYFCFMLYVCAYVCIFVCIDAPSTFPCKKYMQICTYIHIQHTYRSSYMHIKF